MFHIRDLSTSIDRVAINRPILPAHGEPVYGHTVFWLVVRAFHSWNDAGSCFLS